MHAFFEKYVLVIIETIPGIVHRFSVFESSIRSFFLSKALIIIEVIIAIICRIEKKFGEMTIIIFRQFLNNIKAMKTYRIMATEWINGFYPPENRNFSFCASLNCLFLTY